MSLQTHSAIPTYQAALAHFKAQGYKTESQTRQFFQRLLEDLSKERGLSLVPEWPVGHNNRKKIDGAVKAGDYPFPLGFWEAKDENDALETEIQKKRAIGYPTKNTIFEDTQRAILWQNDKQIGEFDLTKSGEVGDLLDRFFGYTEADREGFEEAVRDFIKQVPTLATALHRKIEDERAQPKFQSAFAKFHAVCQGALNPSIKAEQVEEMLVQHLLTERLFKRVFQNDDWFAHNVIAREIEGVIEALTARSWSRNEFLKSLDPFFKVIEDRARTLPRFGDKQTFLDALYERFFQAYSPDTADTMGIVYTPQPIVDWMCASVERTLMKQWGKTLATPDVQILDPCTGTGNFIVNLMGRIPEFDLESKYKGRTRDANGNLIPELWANEIMLLPYYVASGNIEHHYFERMAEHASFEGLCFQDTLDLNPQMTMFTEENSERVARQKGAPLTVIIGNPPYNVGQQNENDNNKNRTYKGAGQSYGVDDLIKKTYAKASNATLQNKLYDAYVRFFKWAEYRLDDRDGIVCFVTNNSFVHKNVFDGMRLTLSKAFNQIWHFDLGGDARSNDGGGNVFGIMVGVGITILVKNQASQERFIRYHRVPDDFNQSEKLEYIANTVDVDGVQWQELEPNKKNAWLTEGLEADFETFVPIGTKAARASFSPDSKTIFKTYSLGASTNRDEWVYNFDKSRLSSEVRHFTEFYNSEVERWAAHKKKKDNFDDFVKYDEKSIKWSSTLKNAAKGGKLAIYSEEHFRVALYRPFSKRHLYYDELLIDRAGAFGRYFPKDKENRVIVISDIGHRTPFSVLMTDCIPDLHLCSTSDGFQCFPLCIYGAKEDSEGLDNITGYALKIARAQWGEVSREDIFYATYALLHAPSYRAKFAENLKRELPRLPLDALPLDPAQWRQLVEIGRKLGDLHVGYDAAPIHPMGNINTTPKGAPFETRVGEKKMKWNADKTTLRVNGSTELRGFTPAMFEYRLGNRSALDWVVVCSRQNRRALGVGQRPQSRGRETLRRGFNRARGDGFAGDIAVGGRVAEIVWRVE